MELHRVGGRMTMRQRQPVTLARRGAVFISGWRLSHARWALEKLLKTRADEDYLIAFSGGGCQHGGEPGLQRKVQLHFTNRHGRRA